MLLNDLTSRNKTSYHPACPARHSPEKCCFKLRNSLKHAVLARLRQEKRRKTLCGFVAAGPHTSVWGFHEKVGRCQVRGFDEGFGEALAWLPDSIPIAAGRASFDRASIRTVGYVHSRTLCWLGSCLVGAAFSESACGRKLSPPSAAPPHTRSHRDAVSTSWLLPFRSHLIFPFPS